MLGQKFPKMDSMLGHIDPYIDVNSGFLKSPKKFKYSKSQEVAEFNQMFKIPIAWPASSDKLRV